MTDETSTGEPIEAVTFYWRQGCGFCSSLDRQLRKHGIPTDKRNIWDDPAHAAVVRSVANGNETVPTVVIGKVAMVNPRIDQVVAVLSEQAPHLVAARDDESAEGPLDKLRTKIFGD